ncbi:MAG: 2-methylthioadenine synthetase [Thermoprotei archaeon]|nr:MAG: 2-methylthioadenine synthetase [Thermoprotei archaeon]
MTRVYIETYGCALNRGDTGLMKSLLVRAGYELVEDPEDADVIILNTCVVRYDTEVRMLKRINALYQAALKKGKKLIVAGCMAKALPFTIHATAPKAILLSPQNIHRVVEVVRSAAPGEKFIDGTKAYPGIPTYSEGVRATIPVSEGCLDNCSFCIVKIARRDLKSIPIEKVVAAVSQLVKRGVVEIEITGQDLGVYGYDIYGRSALTDLIETIISKVEGDYVIRIGQINPQWLSKFLDELVNVLKDRHVYKYLHIPVQSGDNKVLKVMNRRYSVEEFEDIVMYLRRKITGIQIATDIIVGHPREDEKAFTNTIELLTRLEIDRVHIARYSPRPFTSAASMPQIPDPIKKQRSRKLEQIYEAVGLSLNSEYVGSLAEVLITERGLRPKTVVGRLYNYRPVVLRGEASKLLGKKAIVEVKKATFFDLRGELLKLLD